MNETRPYSVLIALPGDSAVDDWVNLAASLMPAGGEIHLRGMIAIAEEVSLSEGARPAQQWRDSLNRAAVEHPLIHDEVKVYVDYHPMQRVLDELHEFPVDLLLVQWMGPGMPTGGVSTDDVLHRAPCDVVLICGDDWQQAGPVLLSLRGGPNITLGVRVAKALAQQSTITLFHGDDQPRAAPNLALIKRVEPQITRTVTAWGNIAEGILHESAGHKAIVLGATFRLPDADASAPGTIIQYLRERCDLPLVLVRAWRPEALEFHAPRLFTRPEEDLSTRVDRWFAESTFDSDEFADLGALVALKEKQGVTISVGLPALNEEQTVGNVIRTLKTALMDDVPLVDEIVLIDSDSADNTVAIAQSCGIPTYKHPEILPEVGSVPGKGEALWKSLHVLKGDIIAWVDTDITNIHPRFIYGLLGPLLKHPRVQYVKGFYQRPIKVGDKLQAYGGGRVTELVARPLLNLFYPELSGIVQPLSGEYAGRRAALEQTPFFSGYGVETGLLLDLLERFGLEAIAQTDLKMRVHHNQPLEGLSKMSFAILQVFFARLDARYALDLLDKINPSMKLIVHDPHRFALEIAQIGDAERPPILTIPAYVARRAKSVEF